MLYVFIGCLAFGIVYAAVSGFLDAEGLDGGGTDADIGADSTGIPSPLSPLVIAGAIITFGAAGLIGKVGFGLSDIVSTAISVGFAGAIGTAIFFGIVRLLHNSQSNSAFSKNDLVGMEADVITPVPESGLGEIACVINGTRYTFSARSAYAEPIPKGERVKIKAIDENTAWVTRRMTVDDLDRLQEENLGQKKEEKMNH